jgi:chromosome segregation ATPase
MNFILNENKRFILEERFILNETVLLEAQATAKQLVIDLTKLTTLLPELLRYLPIDIDKTLSSDPTISDAIEAVNTKRKEVRSVINAGPAGTTLEKTLQKISARASSNPVGYSEEEIQALQPLCYSIASDGNSIKDRLKDIKGKKGNLAEQLPVLQERLPKLEQEIKNLYELEAKTYRYTLNNTAIDLPVGKTFKLEVTVEPKKAVSITFRADGDAISVTKDGLITALRAGEAKVITFVDGKERKDISCLVTVVID